MERQLRGLAYGLLDLAAILKAMHERNAKAPLAVRAEHLTTGYSLNSHHGLFSAVVEVRAYSPRINDIHLVGDLETSPEVSYRERDTVLALTELRSLKVACVSPSHRALRTNAVRSR